MPVSFDKCECLKLKISPAHAAWAKADLLSTVFVHADDDDTKGKLYQAAISVGGDPVYILTDLQSGNSLLIHVDVEWCGRRYRVFLTEWEEGEGSLQGGNSKKAVKIVNLGMNQGGSSSSSSNEYASLAQLRLSFGFTQTVNTMTGIALSQTSPMLPQNGSGGNTNNNAPTQGGNGPPAPQTWVFGKTPPK